MLVPPTWRTTEQPQQSTGEERIEATKSSTLWERDYSNSNMNFVNKNHSIRVSSLAVTNENLLDK
jgi:hypothetical protein